MPYLYKKIADQLLSEINKDTYASGKKLPSLRHLTAQYHCSKSTVEKAYRTLLDAHIIYCKAQSGYYVVNKNTLTIQGDLTKCDFTTGNPRIDAFPLDDLKHCLDRAIDAHKDVSLNIGLENITSLNSVLPRYLSEFQVFTSLDNIFVNLGIMQVLTILCEMPFPNGKTKILIEEPTYSFFIRYLKHKNYPVICIPRGPNGIDIKQLNHIFETEDIKFFYTIPRAHNPLGTHYSSDTKKVICAMASLHDVYLVEDDYFGDFDINSRNYSMYSYGFRENHIYLKSFSKLIPWIRIGISVIPTQLIKTFHEYANYAYYTSYSVPDLVSQATLDMYLRSSIIQKHSTLLKQDYRKKLRTLVKELQKLKMLGIESCGGDGLYCLVYLPTGTNEQDLIKELGKHNVFVSEGANHFYQDNPSPCIRISIANVNPLQIERGFGILREYLQSKREQTASSFSNLLP